MYKQNTILYHIAGLADNDDALRRGNHGYTIGSGCGYLEISGRTSLCRYFAQALSSALV